MKFEYTITENDYLEFNLFHVENSKSLKRMKIFFRCMIPLAAVVILLYEIIIKSSFSFFSVMLLFLISLVWFIYYPHSFKKSYGKSAMRMIKEGKNRDMLGNHTIELSDYGVIETSENGEMKISWDGIEKYLESNKYFYIYMSSIAAFIVPKTAFNNVEQEKDFRSFIEKKTVKG